MTLNIYTLPEFPVVVEYKSPEQWRKLKYWLLDNIQRPNFEYDEPILKSFPNITIHFVKQQDAVWFALTWA